jgi:hypothetical protein
LTEADFDLVSGEADGEGNALQPVRLVLLLIDGPRRGENDFLEFSSIDAAVAHGRELYGHSRFQLDGIEDAHGRSVIGYDHLNDLCRSPQAVPQRRYG